MDAVKYILAKGTMCETYGCAECPISNSCDPTKLTEAGVKRHVNAVEKWAKEREEAKRAEIKKHIEWLRDNGAKCYIEHFEDGDRYTVVVDHLGDNGDGKA